MLSSPVQLRDPLKLVCHFIILLFSVYVAVLRGLFGISIADAEIQECLLLLKIPLFVGEEVK